MKKYCWPLLFTLFALPLQGGEKSPSSQKWSEKKLTFEDARHLLSRTSFGGTPQEIRALTKMTYREAVEKLLSTLRQSPKTAPPQWLNKAYPDYGAARKKGKEFYKKFIDQINRDNNRMRIELKGWWFKEMCLTGSPFTERLALFWHNHFTSDLRKTVWPPFMYHQVNLFRQYGTDDFRSLLHSICKDPAMVVYLDNQTNRKGRPNENFARELMELFTLGEGHYAERDIKESARAFTGYMVDFRNRKFYFHPRLHDWSTKTFLGKKGLFTGEDIVEILLKQKRTACYIVEKLWREFVSETPNPKEVLLLARIFRQGGYRMKPLLRALFLSPHFWNPANRGTMIKSPVELLVGTMRVFKMEVPSKGISLAQYSQRLGQDLLDPPNVKGWPGGNRWITSITLLSRRNVLKFCMANRGFRTVRIGYCNQGCAGCVKKRTNQIITQQKLRKDQTSRILARMELTGKITGSKIENLQKTLLPIRPLKAVPRKMAPLDMVSRLIMDPGYQLK